MYVISTNTGVSCSHMCTANFQLLSEGCLMIIVPICTVSFAAAVIRTGAGVWCVSASIICSGVSNSNQLTNGIHACWVSSNSHAIPQMSSVSSGSTTVMIPLNVLCVYRSSSSVVVM